MNELKVIIHENKRVLTTSQLADSYGADNKKVTENFNNNKERYKEGKHYFLLVGEELKEFKRKNENFGFAQNLNKLYFWTEKGAWLHAKSLNTDKAWEAYELLVDEYYRLAELQQPKLPTTYKEALLALVEEVEKNEALTNDNLILTQQVTEYKPKVEYVDTILNNPSLLNITQIAKDYGMSGAAMNNLLSSLKVQYKSSGQWLLYSNHQSYGYTQSDTTSYVDKGITKTKLRTKWTQKGRLFIYELLKKNGVLPLIEKE